MEVEKEIKQLKKEITKLWGYGTFICILLFLFMLYVFIALK